MSRTVTMLILILQHCRQNHTIRAPLLTALSNAQFHDSDPSVVLYGAPSPPQLSPSSSAGAAPHSSNLALFLVVRVWPPAPFDAYASVSVDARELSEKRAPM